MADERDPIADTGRFRAFAAGAEPQPGGRPRGPLIGVVIAVIVVAAVVTLLLTR